MLVVQTGEAARVEQSRAPRERLGLSSGSTKKMLGCNYTAAQAPKCNCGLNILPYKI